MTKRLLSYNARSKCCKCGSVKVSSVYHRSHCNYYYSADNVCHRQDSEHIIRTCQRCFFAWLESPLKTMRSKEGKTQ